MRRGAFGRRGTGRRPLHRGGRPCARARHALQARSPVLGRELGDRAVRHDQTGRRGCSQGVIGLRTVRFDRRGHERATGATAALGRRAGAIPLTPRQLEVLKLMAHGHSNEEIARRLGLQRNTVKFHISQIFRRLGVRNRIEAAARLLPEDRR